MNQPNRKIVALGGGTGLGVVLRGLKTFACELTAVVTVTDDGGSSGRLREHMGILPPGDIRNCLLALAEAEPDMAALFNHRFSKGELKGHNFGNLFLAAMTEITGDFQKAVRAMSRILAVKGKVLPATLTDVSLKARMEDGSVITGEVAISSAPGKIEKIELQPANPPALDDAIAQIQSANGIIIGPGSLFTSIIPNLLVKDIRNAIYESKAPKLYICNVMTEPGETDKFAASDHVLAIEKHAGTLFSHVLINTAKAPMQVIEKYAVEEKQAVIPDLDVLKSLGYKPISGDYLAKGDLAHHDPFKLAQSVTKFLNANTKTHKTNVS